MSAFRSPSNSAKISDRWFRSLVGKDRGVSQGVDPTGEVHSTKLRAATGPRIDPAELHNAVFVVVAVPTPVDAAHQPDFGPLLAASASVGSNLKRGATVVFESTVYPGATEEICVPVIEQHSGMQWKRDFFVGYSPERINPGDKEHTLTRITKVVSGDTPETLERVAAIYGSIVTAGVYRRAASASQRPPRSSRIRSAISTSR
jgi:UDP-N-acetyl-D-galactosamine dehydrogenase